MCVFETGRFVGLHKLATTLKYLKYELKEKKTHGFSSCIVINICPLQILTMKKAWEYRGN